MVLKCEISKHPSLTLKIPKCLSLRAYENNTGREPSTKEEENPKIVPQDQSGSSLSRVSRPKARATNCTQRRARPKKTCPPSRFHGTWCHPQPPATKARLVARHTAAGSANCLHRVTGFDR
ncbi:hypothetical protein L210DRAFT_428639 [Boletus edulis BED1]|uniref:Uncharacterized protein n=1 Tax=Boletus edulis BED1 TaxID=1328754 RepID=A0AAD4GAG3_BOLED|nr:hypothetical protein L210DRAFT_428639 [Boletus edulis BED1]